MLPHFIELNNRVLDRFTPEERKKIGIHTCPGGDRDSVHSADFDYAELLPSMFQMNAGYFLIQLASERDRERAYKLIGQHSREDANGVPQMCYVGVCVTQSPRAESPQEICDQLIAASKYIPKERLGSTDDCGFSPSVSTRSRITARRTMPVTSRSRRSRTASTARGWPRRSSASNRARA